MHSIVDASVPWTFLSVIFLTWMCWIVTLQVRHNHICNRMKGRMKSSLLMQGGINIVEKINIPLNALFKPIRG